ncbi:hypothetical protein [Spiroplasma floricola]|uniref:Lipoprotein n=1 Tax=Spiroplasma floricola 23-6 TaxID=1336749 RepID=A0A2K8SE99_9MOLU|nr:hypothetical protein [Spiroplasma floricola]AUB31781.1 hypothetical protein SFLOR_v1c07330 [Spiroplasma floricola 23-6]
MKRLLMLFSICAIITGTSSSIVACGTKSITDIYEVDQDLLKMLKNEANLKYDSHFIKNNIPFVQTFDKADELYEFFNSTNLANLYTNSQDGEIKISINSLANLDSFNKDLQKHLNLEDLKTDINSLKNSDKNNYSIFLSKVNSVYANYEFGPDFIIRRQIIDDNITYTGNFEVNFKWQYYTESVNTETYNYKGSFIISEDKELIPHITEIANVGKKFFNDETSLIHFNNKKLDIDKDLSWKNVSQNILKYFKLSKMLTHFLKK